MPPPTYTASARDRQLHDYYANLKSEKKDAKNPASIEEWDCPRPGAQNINKTAKENRKLIEKKMRGEFKKKKRTESTDSIGRALPAYIQR